MQRFYGSTAIDGTMAAADVAYAVLRKQFVAMLSEEEGTIEGADSECLHDMRVATRRMRAAFGVFGDHLYGSEKAFEKDLKWIGGMLGKVRDLDVQLEHQRQWAALLGAESELAPWINLVETERSESRKGLVIALRSDRYADFCDAFGKLLVQGPSASDSPNIVTAAPLVVRKRWRKFKNFVRDLAPDRPDEDFHIARIAAKRLRYSVEFVAPVYGPAAKELAVAVSRLQDILGLHQDCTVAKEMIKAKLAKGWKKLPASTCFELGRLSCHTDSIKLEQRDLVKPAFDATRLDYWPALKVQMAALAELKGKDLV